MVLYRYALDSSDNIILADSLVGVPSREAYRCISCGRELIPRVNGAVQRPHFGHKSVGECNGETYYHFLAKKVFEDTFNKCKKNAVPFMIRFTAPRVCNRFKPITNRVCDVGSDQHEYDLTQYFTDIRIEKRDGKFIPDISLHSRDRPSDVLYIEIAVTHFLSDVKQQSGKRIIEIHVSDEDDIELIGNGIIDETRASFTGFYPTINLTPDADCECARRNYFAFYVFRSGNAHLDHGSLRSLEPKINKMKPNLTWINLTEEYVSNDGYDYYNHQTPNRLFNTSVDQAYAESVPFKNCYLCEHSGKTWGKVTEHHVFCKLHKKSCDSNYANRCNDYRIAKYRTRG